MISPSPTQPTPEAEKSTEPKQIRSTPSRKRMGESPGALFAKRLLRPIFKGFYYGIQGIRGHKLLALGMIVLLLATISATTFFTTGQWPMGIGSDQFQLPVHSSSSSNSAVLGDHVKNWLYALRDGNAAKLALVRAELAMSTPPDPNQLVAQFSEPQGHLTWKSINVAGVYPQSDTTVDSFVSVDVEGNGPGGATKGIMVWHFVTLPQQQGRLLSLELVSFRASAM